MLGYLIGKAPHIYNKTEAKVAQYLCLHIPGIKEKERIWTFYSGKTMPDSGFYFCFGFSFASKTGIFFFN